MNGNEAGLMHLILLVGAGYLVGAIPFGLLAGWLRGVDIRRVGSGNIGATNAGRVLGRGYGIGVFVLDFLKGYLPVWIGGRILMEDSNVTGTAGMNVFLLWVLIAAGCVLGHMFPIYLRFKGGKGVATSAGAMLGIQPFYTWPALAVLGVWVLVTGISRYVSLGSIVAAIAFPIIFGLLAWRRGDAWPGPGQLWPLHLFGVLIALLVVYRHRANIGRLLAGTEPKIGGSRRDTADPKPIV